MRDEAPKQECPECTMFQPVEATSCEYCGAALTGLVSGLGSHEEEERQECPGCSMLLSMDAPSCEYCGVGLSGTSFQSDGGGSAGVPAPGQEEPEEAPADDSPKQECSGCTMLLPVDVTRCEYCGTVLSGFSLRQSVEGGEIPRKECPGCSMLLPVEVMTCEYCGADLGGLY